MQPPQKIPLSRHVEENGSVIVFEEGTVPFSVQRTFIVTAEKGQVRGNHAHRVCSQLLMALSGQILVSVENGTQMEEFLLSGTAEGLIIPPMNWATQTYMSERSMLLVVCDLLFDESDYIRDFEEFKRLIRN